jgi:hypothetical protein
MNEFLATIIIVLGLSTVTLAQNIGINTDGSNPDKDALLHVNRTIGAGIDSALIRIENEENATVNNVTGLQFLNSSTGNTSRWSLYNPGLGSTDFRFKNNGSDYVTILNDGKVGLGTTTPWATLHVWKPFGGAFFIGDTMGMAEKDGALYTTYDSGFNGAVLNLEESGDPVAIRGIQSVTSDTALLAFHNSNLGVGTVFPKNPFTVHIPSGDAALDNVTRSGTCL